VKVDETVKESGYVLTVQDLDSTIVVKERDYIATSQSKSNETVKESGYVLIVQDLDLKIIIKERDYIARSQSKATRL
jgi:hypothetical protein